MTWSLDESRTIWKCSSYTDVTRTAINNLAYYGQPMAPGEPGYDASFKADFRNVVIEMPQREVMEHGYGRNIGPFNFPLVRNFLNSFGEPPLNRYPYGNYSFKGLVKHGFAGPKDRFIKAQLYIPDPYGIDSGEVDSWTARYVHGWVTFALMARTTFTYAPGFRRVRAEIGAGDDNWDFHSRGPVEYLEPFVQLFAGPPKNNLLKKNGDPDGQIEIRYRGHGKMMTIESLSLVLGGRVHGRH